MGVVSRVVTEVNVLNEICVILVTHEQLNRLQLNRARIVSKGENHSKRGDIWEPLWPLPPPGTIDPLPSSINSVARGALRKSLALLSVGWTGFRDAPLLQLVSVTAMKKPISELPPQSSCLQQR